MTSQINVPYFAVTNLTLSGEKAAVSLLNGMEWPLLQRQVLK